jgi:hypothetical protein
MLHREQCCTAQQWPHTASLSAAASPSGPTAAAAAGRPVFSLTLRSKVVRVLSMESSRPSSAAYLPAAKPSSRSSTCVGDSDHDQQPDDNDSDSRDSAAHTAADTKQLQLPFAVIHTLQSCMHAALCTQSAMSSNTCTWSNPFHHSAFDLTPAPSSRALQACRPLTTNIRQKWQCSL